MGDNRGLPRGAPWLVSGVSASRIAISRVEVPTHDSLGRVGRGDEQHLSNIIQEGAEIGRWRSVDDDHAHGTADAYVAQNNATCLTRMGVNIGT